MIGLDTNVVIRYLTEDDPKQSAQACKLIENQLSIESPGYISLVTLVEITWVLGSCYSQPKAAILRVLRQLLNTRQVLLERADMAKLAIAHFSKNKVDFSDSLILTVCQHAGCEKVVSFDKKALAAGMQKVA